MISLTRQGRQVLASALFFWAGQSPGAWGQSEGGEKSVLEEVVVTAHQREYRLDSARSALGFDLKLIETPAAISVITEDLLKDQQVNNVDDALRNVAGVNKFKTGNGGEEKFSIRGFDASQSIYKDGARINNPLNASNIPSTESANIDRIEVLKGSSALLYGEGKPGGIINYITKRPQLERTSSVELLYGSDAYKKVELDTTGALLSNDLFAYRLVAAYEDSDSFRKEVERKRLLLNPTLAFMPVGDLKIVSGYEYIDDEYTQDRGQVLDGNNVEGYRYSNRLKPALFFGIPDWNSDTHATSHRMYVVADYQVMEAWQLSANFSRTKNDKKNFDASSRPIWPDLAFLGAAGTPEADQAAIQPRKSRGEGNTHRYKLQSIIDISDPMDFQHKILTSASYEDFDTTATSFVGDRLVRFNLATGDYFTPDMDPVKPGQETVRIGNDILFGLSERGQSTSQDYNESGINVLDYITFDAHWAWLIGGRYSVYEDKLNDFDDDNVSVRTGVVYNAFPNLSFYGSYAQGFTNSAGRLNENNSPVDPETSTTWELGAKWEIFDQQLLMTATLYRVENEDLIFIVNPDAPIAEQFYDNLGAIESRGLELEAVGFINEFWRVQAGYSYINNEITNGGTSNNDAIFRKGNTLPGIADHSFNVFSLYEFSLGPGFVGAGGGVFYQGEVYISAENRGEYGSWTQVDLAAYYKWNAWKLQFNVKNLLDEEYQQAQALVPTDTFAAARVGTATPLSYIVSVAYEF
ncbi:MAG: TonB-dependent receptor [Halioglobus sp.]|nr:TonB-dependent receptor [Halioglobus sp.]